VVADEVRRLAQRSRESVDSVRLLLDEFASSIRATVIATEEGSKEAARVLERARAAAVAIEELRDAIGTTARAASEISLATDQQRTASDQVVMTLKELSQVIQRIAEGLKAFTGAAERLNHTALSIQLLTQTFHSESPRSLKHVAGQWAAEVAERAGHWDAVESRLKDFLARSPFVEVAYLVDRTGNMILHAVNGTSEHSGSATAPVTAGSNYSDRPWFQAVLREQRTILTPLYDSLLTGERCFTVAAPVPAADGGLAGVLGFDVNVRGWARI
jgi:methyl-accepting chemotaxis protein